MDIQNFNSQFNPLEELDSSLNIIILSERNGRKCNTYVFGWDIEKSQLKDHLKNLKRKHGCNGSIKKHLLNGLETECIHLQGEWKDAVQTYLLNNGVSESEIEIKQ